MGAAKFYEGSTEPAGAADVFSVAPPAADVDNVLLRFIIQPLITQWRQTRCPYFGFVFFLESFPL